MKKMLEALSCFISGVRNLPPARLALLGYLSYIIIGWILLSLPFVQKGMGVGPLDNLFTATSAVSTTGLTTVSVADSYNIWGQLIVMVLIQLGGIGYMTLGSFVILSKTSVLSERRQAVGRVVFSLPATFRLDKFVRSVILFTLLIEAAGALALYLIFIDVGVARPLWSAVFHSVSAFCTAGFGLYNNSFEGFSGHFFVNTVIAALSYLGAIGFIVFVDIWRRLKGKVQEITLTSKIILWTTFWLSLAGTALIYIAEPTIQSMTPDKRLMAAFFQAMTAMTTVGFNTISISDISRATLLVIIFLMIIGASPSGTGGGLKSTTFSAIFGVMRSALRGEREVRFWRRPVPLERVWTAIAGLGFYITALVVGTYLLELTENFGFEQILFEAASALGTVGLSTGITSALSNIGKVIIILLMFCGRLGPLTFGIALISGKAKVSGKQDNDLAV